MPTPPHQVIWSKFLAVLACTKGSGKETKITRGSVKNNEVQKSHNRFKIMLMSNFPTMHPNFSKQPKCKKQHTASGLWASKADTILPLKME